ncbi:ABC transporter ATP-binding protein [Flavihumibacter petaseus]|uniref:Putative ABC transporter permease/ATP-binding protein n=1 Tax=Flavihumibacter petaseus NBRC 106054 TaxID=1220578 RepID=A0A0E9N4W1_9BACT|nr:ABC transporter ATP-binding protein [Flavihumibacter petaseus]GAO44997.1 putative ABC transporter permease/ATP-binding protein [Flavihumibacter petaseus NBRC 106054]
MKILLHYLKPYKWLVFITLLLAAINTGFSLIDPIIFGRMTKIAFDYKNYKEAGNLVGFRNAVLWLLLLSISVAMVSRIAKAFQDYFFNVITQKFGAKVFTDGLKHAMKLPFHEFEDQRSGETLSVLQKVETDTEKFISNFINVLFGVLIGIVFVSIYAFSLHWSLPLVYFGGIILLTVITNYLSKRIKKIQKNIVAQTTSLAGTTTESLRNIELIKSLGLTNQEVERLNKNTYKILGLELTKVKRVRSLSFVQGTVVNTLRQVIMFILMWLIYREKMTPENLVTMQIFSFFIFSPLQEIGNILLSYREAEASLLNFRNLMDKKPEARPEHPVSIPEIRTLAFNEVSFHHKTAPQPAINRISFQVRKGETIAFVGPSGAGKTTLVKLLVGLYRPQQGGIVYNGVNENEIDYEDLRKQIGFVTQDTQLFSGTIRENLLFVNPGAGDDALYDALHKASADNLIARASNGVDTMIGEGGLKLSGGEKQRLSIARSLLRHPRLLIFDEATSALDSITEEEITRTIRSISAQREQITVLIAHRLSTIMHADRIYVLEKGEIVETGTHDSLLAEKGLYFAMWRQQIGERKTTAMPVTPVLSEQPVSSN